MDSAILFVTGIGLASSLTTSALTLYIIDNFGTLANSGEIYQETTGPRLLGAIPNAIAAMSIVTIMVLAILLIYTKLLLFKSFRSSPTFTWRMFALIFFATSFTVQIITASLSIHMMESFADIEDLGYSPSTPTPGENYKIAGPYGEAVFGMSISSICVALISYSLTVANIYTKKSNSFKNTNNT